MIPFKKMFDYPKVEQVNPTDGSPRYYICPNTGDRLPSVTSILGATQDKTYLVEWEKRVGTLKAEEVRKEAADLGTLVHTHLENYCLGDPRPKPRGLFEMLAERMANKVIREGLGRVDAVVGSEVRMYYPGLYAGTTDLVGFHEGKLSIMDYKTTRYIKDASQIQHYMYQAASYIMAHDIVHETQIDKAVIFMVSRDMQYEEFVLNKNQVEKAKEGFLKSYERYLDIIEKGA